MNADDDDDRAHVDERKGDQSGSIGNQDVETD